MNQSKFASSSVGVLNENNESFLMQCIDDF